MGRYLIAAALSVAALLGQEFKLGTKVDDFALRDTNGGVIQFASLRGPVTVVIFISTKCPVSNSYNDRMNAIYKDYSQRGVKFVFVNSNHGESLQEVAQHARDHFSFPVYKDEDNVVADRFGATVTPEAFVIDSTGTIRYHGSIDDSQIVQRVQENRLRNALDSVLEDKPVTAAETKAFGCSIKRIKKAS
jgi:peroxiredoxin